MVRLIGVVLALCLVGISAYLFGAKPWCDITDEQYGPTPPLAPVRASSDVTDSQGGVLPAEAVKLAFILSGRQVPKNAEFVDYYEICVSLGGTLGGIERCSELLEDTDGS